MYRLLITMTSDTSQNSQVLEFSSFDARMLYIDTMKSKYGLKFKYYIM